MHVVLRFSKPVTVRGELVKPLVSRQHWPSTGSGRTDFKHNLAKSIVMLPSIFKCLVLGRLAGRVWRVSIPC